MLRNLFFALLCVMPMLAVAQGENPVKWEQSVTDKGDGLYTVELKAEIGDGWHIYVTDPAFTLNPTTFEFSSSEGVAVEGELRSLSNAHLVKDEYGLTSSGQEGYFEREAIFEQDFKVEGKGGEVKVAISYQACNVGTCLSPTTEEITITLGEATAPKAEIKAVKDAAGSGSLWSLIIEAVLWGFMALLTPCVFPMVPMTVSFFMKNSGSAARGRINASLYGLFIIALYTLPIAILIIITRVAGGDAVTADIFNWLATHWLPNIVFFIVFMIFAASFFGAFEITMPSALVNKSDAQSDRGGIGGIFFMALTLVLVSFSCTGPIVGSVLIKSTSGEVWSPIVTMLAFSTAFALPFTIFAFFPSLLKKLPRGGGWLNSVKVVLGFIEVALGFKFLSVADQVYHWNLLDREVYLAIWIVVFSLLGLYLLGKIKFAHDEDLKHLGIGRLAMAIGVFTFVVYMIPGMWGAPLKALSGYLPPLSSQDFVLGAQSVAPTAAATSSDIDNPKYGDFLHLPHGLKGFFDMKEAEAYAEKVGKPIFIDFTGHGCVNCREMEARVWADPTVQQILREEYVIVALYTDDKMKLEKSDWVTAKNGDVLKTLGAINANYALTRFGVNAQPYYVLQGKEGAILGEPRGYDLSVEGFVEFLRKGVEEYNK
ncbi:MAG: thioredoxin family protein [Alistipes sp.]|nr:thioredoxin family protein [Alistipes sp.]